MWWNYVARTREEITAAPELDASTTAGSAGRVAPRSCRDRPTPWAQ